MSGILKSAAAAVLLGLCSVLLGDLADTHAGQPGGPPATKPPLEALKKYTSREIACELCSREVVVFRREHPGLRDLDKLPALKTNPHTTAPLKEVELRLASSGLRLFTPSELIAELRDRQRQKGVYGADNRTDLFVLENRRDQARLTGLPTDALDRQLENAAGVACLFWANALHDFGNGQIGLSTGRYGMAEELCLTERFYDQPVIVGDTGTGFVVGKDLIATAGHCVKPPKDITKVRFVFGFRMTDAKTAVTKVSAAQVYHGKELVGYAMNSETKEDWAIVRVDRPIPQGIKPLRIRRTAKIADKEDVYVIGYPSGLPCKVGGGAFVRKNDHGQFFVANLDTYAGNSGSPVFNQRTHEVEGILVRGGEDFRFLRNGDSGCRVSVILADEDGRGEDVTRTTIFAGKVP